jgi:hypothetical protein
VGAKEAIIRIAAMVVVIFRRANGGDLEGDFLVRLLAHGKSAKSE